MVKGSKTVYVSRRIFYLFSLFIVFVSCSPDFKRDGGSRFVVEADIATLLKEEMKGPDSMALTLISETYRELEGKDGDFLDLYFLKLEKSNSRVPGSYFNTTARTGKECSTFFHDLLNKKMDRIAFILCYRLDLFGVAPNAKRDFKINRIIAEIPGNSDPKRLRQLLQTSADLEFWETYENQEIYPLLEQANERLSQILPVNESLDSNARKYPLRMLLRPYVMYDTEGNMMLAEGAIIGTARPNDTAQINKFLSKKEIRSLFGIKIKFHWSTRQEDKTKICELYALKADSKGKAAMFGEMITEASVDHSQNGSGAPFINITMTPEAGETWQKLTKANIGKYLAIVLDGKVYSCPKVNSEIQGGKSMISGNFTLSECEDLASILKAGYLPLPVRIIKEEQVAPNQ